MKVTTATKGFILDLRTFILGIAVFGTIGGLYVQIQILKTEIARLNTKIETIENDQTFTRQLVTSSIPQTPLSAQQTTPTTAAPLAATASTASTTTKERSDSPRTESPLTQLQLNRPPVKLSHRVSDPDQNWKVTLLRMLKQINQDQPKKRIFILANQITVADPNLASEDAFFDTLGFLIDEDHYAQILLPKKEYESPLKIGLTDFGVPEPSIRLSKAKQITIQIKD